MRAALGNRDLVRFTIAHVCAILAKRAMFVGALVYVFERGGVEATGVTTIALLTAHAATAPFAGTAVRRRPNRVRLASFGTVAVVFGAAAAAAFASTPVFVVAGPCVIGVAAHTFIRPASAVLVPAIVRTSRELTVANVWMGYGDGLSVLGAALVATGLLALQGPPLVLAGCAALALTSFLIGVSHRHIEVPPPAEESEAAIGPLKTTARTLAAMWKLPGTGSVLVVLAALEVLLGSLDLVIVVLAGEALDLGRAGAGVLSTFLGVGTLLSIPATTALVRRARLAPVLVAGLCVIALAAIGLGVVTTLGAALVLLPVVGCCLLVLFVLSRMLLQRSVPPTALGATFGVLELIAGLGRVAGAIASQLLIALAGVDAALIGIGVFFGVLLVAIQRPLRSADDFADVPVVAISLLRRLPVFAPLPEISLEAVARGAIEVPVVGDEVITREGELGDRFFAVADGRFDVAIDGELVRTLSRGDSFGEIASADRRSEDRHRHCSRRRHTAHHRARALPRRGHRPRPVSSGGMAGDPIAAPDRRATRIGALGFYRQATV